MDNYGFLSILPPVVAIALALRTKQVYVSLTIGIWFAWLIIDSWNPLTATIDTIQNFVDVFKSPGNTRTIMYVSLVGALLLFIQYSGGVQGFMDFLNKKLEKIEKKYAGRSRIVVQLLALLTGMLLFVETSVNCLTTGTLYRPIFDRLKIPREKLAYIVDSVSAPSAILIPFNAWGAFIMGLLITAGIDNSFGVMISALKYNYYPMITVLMVFLIIVTKKDLWTMAKAEKRTRETGKLMNDDAKPMVSAEVTSMQMKEGVKPRAYNMIVPILTMVLLMPVNLAYTGWNQIDANENLSFIRHVFLAIGKGSGSTAVLLSVFAAILLAMVMYRIQKIMKFKEAIDLMIKGISGLIPLSILMILAFSLSSVTKELGTGVYVANLSKNWMDPALLPAVIFVISSFIAFSTGTSWGTFAIMMSIAVPMAEIHHANLYLAVAATLGGGVFGDHCSPISDTTIISSMASACDHIDHVNTQLPYALLAGTLTTILYILLGYLT